MALSLQRYTWSDFSTGLNYLLKERNEQERERSKMITIKMGDYLPECVIIEILSWLPVKDLLQLKSVCKSWNAIISSPSFISNHLNNYYTHTDAWRSCLLTQYHVSQGEIQLLELLVDETPRVLDREVLYNIPIYASFVCGPCDGIYYLYQCNYSSTRILWNPAINEFKALPQLLVTKPNLPSDITYLEVDDYGFGLDPITKDYKVVVIRKYTTTTGEDLTTNYPLSVFVYSLWTDSWRYCGDLTQEFYLQGNKCYTYIDGFYFWLGSCDYGDTFQVIISFDMGTDAFEEMHLPNYAQPSSNCLGVYDGCISFFTLHAFEKIVDVWTLQQGSWSKKLTIGPFLDIWNLIGHWKDNYIILENYDCKLVIIDPNSQELKDLGFQYEGNCDGVYAYMESLVSLKDKTNPGLHFEEVEVEDEDENNLV